ncbi:hypothetical protein VTN77DRAFT_4716 [Rasamsonia byssochlamydoides]|uniref:uncharacterized protein n=1 Tax=Rasamsonia byssochlamydoides TaxID=89139 RepID=UPI003743DC1F
MSANRWWLTDSSDMSPNRVVNMFILPISRSIYGVPRLIKVEAMFASEISHAMAMSASKHNRADTRAPPDRSNVHWQ